MPGRNSTVNHCGCFCRASAPAGHVPATAFSPAERTRVAPVQTLLTTAHRRGRFQGISFRLVRSRPAVFLERLPPGLSPPAELRVTRVAPVQTLLTTAHRRAPDESGMNAGLLLYCLCCQAAPCVFPEFLNFFLVFDFPFGSAHVAAEPDQCADIV